MSSSSDPPGFPRHDPATAAFWDVRIEADFMPWDQGAVPKCLADYVVRHPAPKHTLIPGCGSAYEAGLFLQAKWPVTAIDFSPAAVAHARKKMGPLGVTVREADFFGAELAVERFDVIYERAFLCALPGRLRTAWAERVAMLLRPGGKLIGFFYFDDSAKGPPFGIDAAELDNLLSANFQLLEERVPSDSIAVFSGKEKWQVWQRNYATP
ncbi:MAG: methyltransferase [Betaproteobacteria bacterium]